ncbi:hypothetical protein [Streptomyces sp. NPDC050287]|uniref:hypothetical protein n=1 Tax=Streptomyces sp. NPDC050287 TaxID=3365608 RepID=UPI0037A513C2
MLARRGGARLPHILKAPPSRTSVLFQLMRIRLPSVATPRVLGVDDFALYADVYGTLLVDADTRLPIEVAAGRDAEQLAALSLTTDSRGRRSTSGTCCASVPTRS